MPTISRADLIDLYNERSDRLSEKEKRIFETRFCHKGEIIPYNKIAKEVDLSTSRVRQLLDRSITKIYCPLKMIGKIKTEEELRRTFQIIIDSGYELSTTIFRKRGWIGFIFPYTENDKEKSMRFTIGHVYLSQIPNFNEIAEEYKKEEP